MNLRLLGHYLKEVLSFDNLSQHFFGIANNLPSPLTSVVFVHEHICLQINDIKKVTLSLVLLGEMSEWWRCFFFCCVCF